MDFSVSLLAPVFGSVAEPLGSVPLQPQLAPVLVEQLVHQESGPFHAKLVNCLAVAAVAAAPSPCL
jgi:hypothetical protein